MTTRYNVTDSANKKITLLLSTYQGEQYIVQQLESIRAQTYHDWKLLVRDDGSSDNTCTILDEYQRKDLRIQCMPFDGHNIGTTQSFAALMWQAQHIDSDYILFCDQDDVWLPTKIATTIAHLLQLESRYGLSYPCLVHTDLCVVDDKLQMISPSYLAYEHLKPNLSAPLNTLLVNNYVTGCTIGMNRALLNLCLPLPKEARMHDWWCALCAAATGVVETLPQATLLYRQHASNVIGSRGFYRKFINKQLINSLFRIRRERLIDTFKQASALHRHLLNNKITISPDRFTLVEAMASFLKAPPIARFKIIQQQNIRACGYLRQLLLWGACLGL